MGIVDPNILLQAQTPNYLGSLLQGMNGAGNLQQMQQQKAQFTRTQAAHAAFAKAAQGEDITKPDGMRNAITKFAQAGFPDEASAVMEAHKDMFQAKPKTFGIQDTDAGLTPYNTETGERLPAWKTNTGEPVYSGTTGAKIKTEKADFNFSKSIPDYEKALAGIGGDMTKRDLLASHIMAQHPDSPKAEKYIQTVLKTQSPFSLTAAPPSQSDQDKWVDFLGNKGDYQTFMQGMNGIRGPNKQKALIDILARTKAKYPDFDVVAAKAGIKQAEDVGNGKVLNLISGVLPNVQNLISLSDKIQRSPVKYVSKAELAASRQFSDEDLANFDQLKTLTADEINQIFAGGKGGSDMSRHMALDLINEQLPPKQFASTVKTLYTAMQNRANGIRSGFQGYGGQRAEAQPTQMPTAHPQDSEAVQWAKLHPNDPRSAKILKANGL